MSKPRTTGLAECWSAVSASDGERERGDDTRSSASHAASRRLAALRRDMTAACSSWEPKWLRKQYY
eukprot:2691919-Heterocapsa_arctica.AAC.1